MTTDSKNEFSWPQTECEPVSNAEKSVTAADLPVCQSPAGQGFQTLPNRKLSGLRKSKISATKQVSTYLNNCNIIFFIICSSFLSCWQKCNKIKISQKTDTFFQYCLDGHFFSHPPTNRLAWEQVSYFTQSGAWINNQAIQLGQYTAQMHKRYFTLSTFNMSESYIEPPTCHKGTEQWAMGSQVSPPWTTPWCVHLFLHSAAKQQTGTQHH